MANPEDSHPKASWAALWLWYKAVRAVETSHRQRVHPSCLLGYGQGEQGVGGGRWDPFDHPIIELLWLNPLSWSP